MEVAAILILYVVPSTYSRALPTNLKGTCRYIPLPRAGDRDINKYINLTDKYIITLRVSYKTLFC